MWAPLPPSSMPIEKCNRTCNWVTTFIFAFHFIRPLCRSRVPQPLPPSPPLTVNGLTNAHACTQLIMMLMVNVRYFTTLPAGFFYFLFGRMGFVAVTQMFCCTWPCGCSLFCAIYSATVSSIKQHHTPPSLHIWNKYVYYSIPSKPTHLPRQTNDGCHSHHAHASRVNIWHSTILLLLVYMRLHMVHILC